MFGFVKTINPAGTSVLTGILASTLAVNLAITPGTSVAMTESASGDHASGVFMSVHEAMPSHDAIPEAVAQPWFQSPQAVAIDVRELKQKDHVIHLPDGQTVRAVTGEMEDRGERSFAWRGRLFSGDHPVGTATYTVVNGRVSGRLRVDDTHYALRHDRQPGHWLGVQDESRLPAPHPEHGPLIPSEPSTAESSTAARERSPADDDDAPVIDVLLVYTDQAIEDVGDELSLRDAMRSAADITNTGFFNSENEARIRVVGVHPMPVDEPADGSQNLV